MYGTKKFTPSDGPAFNIKEGAMTAAAKREGVSNSTYEREHEQDSGKAGKRARMAIAFKHMNHSR